MNSHDRRGDREHTEPDVPGNALAWKGSNHEILLSYVITHSHEAENCPTPTGIINSFDLVKSVESRRGWIEPDMAPQ